MDPARVPWKLRYDLGRRVASRVRRAIVQVTHRHTTVRFGPGCYLGPGFSLDIPEHGELIVGRNVEFRRGSTIEIGGRGRVTIGDDCVFTYDTIIQCSTTVDIGRGCWIGRVLIVDGNHRFKDPTLPVHAQGFDFTPITIGDETLITTNAVVMAPIGRRSFVGANSVVTRPIPDFSLAVGSPAVVVESYAPTGDAAADHA